MLLFFLAMACGKDLDTGDTGSDLKANSPPTDYSESACFGEVRSLVIGGESVAVTCRAEGDTVRVFVADALYESAVTQGDVAGYTWALDQKSPEAARSTEKGLHQNVVEVFSGLTAFDTSEPLEVFVVDLGGADFDLPDDGGLAIQGVAGLGVDARAASARGLVALLDDPSPVQEPWVDDTIQRAGAIVAGYFVEQLDAEAWLGAPGGAWGPDADLTAPDPGVCAMLGGYLYEQLGDDGLQDILASEDIGWAKLEAGLAVGGFDDREALWASFLAALILETSADPYVIRFADLRTPAYQRITSGGEAEGDLQPWGAAWTELDSSITTWAASSNSGDLRRFAIYHAPDGQIDLVEAGDTWSYVGDITEVRRIIAFTAQGDGGASWRVSGEGRR